MMKKSWVEKWFKIDLQERTDVFVWIFFLQNTLQLIISTYSI